ncbi:MAG: TolC family protein [Sedimentisphaerales bacterium]|nr:TolC family protein [Sedimentisphaerales bacterium]
MQTRTGVTSVVTRLFLLAIIVQPLGTAGNVQGQTADIPGLINTAPVTERIFSEENITPVQLTLMESLHRALANNLELRIDSYTPAIRMADVVEAEAAFDAVLFGSAQAEILDETRINPGISTTTVTGGTPGNNTSINVPYPTNPYVNTHDYNYQIGLRKRLPTGAIVELAEGLRRYRDFYDITNQMFNNPYLEYDLSLQIRQPLLRDFGLDFNRASINAARNSYQVGRQQFELSVIDTVSKVERLYWQLVLLRQRVRIYENLVAQAEVTRQRLDYRRDLEASALAVHRVKGLLERARANLISARNDLLQQQEMFLNSLNDPTLPQENRWEVIPLDEPSTSPYTIDTDEAIDRALHLRPEIIAQKLRLDTAGIVVGVSKNQLLPRLDIFARQDVTGAGGNASSAWREQNNLDLINYGAGISFEVPLGGNRAARASVIRAENEYQQEVTRLESIRQQVVADVNVSLHELELSYQEIAVRRSAAQAEADTMSAYLVQEEAGIAITAGYLDRQIDAQERLAIAQLNAAQSLFRYNNAISATQRAQGVILHYNNIKMEESASGATIPVSETISKSD